MDDECEYEVEYRDPGSEEMVTYSCEREKYSEKFCIFHDKDAYIKDEKRVRDEFVKEFGDVGEGERSFIGCNIPLVDVSASGNLRRARFMHAVFHDDATFRNITIEELDFSGAEFYGVVELQNCDLRVAVFIESKFGKIKVIDKVKPRKLGPPVMFERCSFNAFDVSGASFNCDVFFDKCDIEDSYFESCEFMGKLNVYYCEFNDDAEFNGTSFREESKFVDTVFKKGALFEDSNFIGRMYFRRVDFRSQELVTMPSTMSDVSLLGTDIRRVRFSSDTAWETESGDPILDVRGVEDGSGMKLDDVVAVCRRIRDNLDYYMEYPKAGNFFVWEMELHRKYFQNGAKISMKSRHKRWVSLRLLYRITSRYGESLNRVLWAWPVFFAAAYGLSLAFPSMETLALLDKAGGCRITEPCGNYPVFVPALEDMLDALAGASSSGITGHVIRGTALAWLTLTFISARRKIERRFRH